ncbi:MAG: DUF502 domain-containing protein [Candidatus Omnitrophota bacterium]|nr:MAG: DUF502 domain-containing protein [Candidatus Omnitrophota bacterium]
MRRIFFTGLAAIVPIVITVYVIVGLFYFADGILGKYINTFLEKYVDYTIPGLGIILTILIVFIIGLILHISRMRLTRLIEKMLFKIPLVNKIYFPIKKIVDFLFFPPKKTFRSAVLVEYPRKGIYSLGLITNESSSRFEEKTGKKLYNIFIPSSPSPLTGFTIIVEEKDIIFLNIGVDEALKLVVSGGLLNPHG